MNPSNVTMMRPEDVMADETPPPQQSSSNHDSFQPTNYHSNFHQPPTTFRPALLSVFTDDWKMEDEEDTITLKTDTTITKQLLGNRLVYSIGENGIESVVVNDSSTYDKQDDTSYVLKLKKKELSVIDLDLSSLQEVGKGEFGSVFLGRCCLNGCGFSHTMD